ncbi:hypothetical protein [Bartonella tribocorum]|uniref:hypothetical protein n=1 Tax=Bartonella tribocorum TaxID=85701 RepID=UPI00030C5E7A|nr:hypothetical protein [Bartonella tribocorum]CDO49704.1 hypothetical protein BM1374166_02061 [Bartonella tribocorum]
MFFVSCRVTRYRILGFKHKRIEAFYNTGTTKGIRAAHADLGALEGDVAPKDLKLCVLLIVSAKK